MDSNTCFIIGNGKSLNDVPVEFMDLLPTFGANRIYLKYSPTYYVCVNPLVAEQNEDEIQAQTRKSAKSFVTAFVPYAQESPLITPLWSVGAPMFSLKPDEWIWEGGTVTYVSMQLAYWLGFRTVFLIGLDHYFEYDGEPNEEQLMVGDDPNHFDPSYFKGQRWNLPDLALSETAYKLARKMFERDGRKIYNLSTKTALSEDIIERRSLWRTMEQYAQLSAPTKAKRGG